MAQKLLRYDSVNFVNSVQLRSDQRNILATVAKNTRYLRHCPIFLISISVCLSAFRNLHSKLADGRTRTGTGLLWPNGF
jgi:hypothetical protein